MAGMIKKDTSRTQALSVENVPNDMRNIFPKRKNSFCLSNIDCSSNVETFRDKLLKFRQTLNTYLYRAPNV